MRVMESTARYLEADIALLQGHDLYLGCYLPTQPPADTRELIERLLPEAGYITRVFILGSTLQALLQANQSVMDQSPSLSQPIASEQSRALLMYGITTGVTVDKCAKGVCNARADASRASTLGVVDPEETYYINGAPLS